MSYAFTNPYNFVRPVAVPPGNEAKHRRPFVSHDCFDGERLSGEITVDLVTRSPFMAVDTESWWESERTKKHFRYRPLSVGDPSRADDRLQPIASGTQIRGMVRSVLEAATNSCFTVFDETSRFSHRIEGSQAPWLFGGRVEAGPDGRWRLRLLRTAWISMSDVPNGARSGESYEAILEGATHRSRQGRNIIEISLVKVLTVSAESRASSRVVTWADLPEKSRVRFPRPAQPRLPLPEARQRWRARGYLKLTGQNKWQENAHGQIRSAKHDERFFWEDPDLPSLDLEADVVARYDAVLAEQLENYKKEREKTKGRFNSLVPQRPLLPGDLVYALTDFWNQGDVPTKVFEIGAVAVPRWEWHNGPGSLLDDALRPCDALERLCPACRLFGLTIPANRQTRASGYRGRVRFSLARWVGVADRTSGELDQAAAPKLWRNGKPVRLAILGAPKPTTYEFYLRGPSEAPADYDAQGVKLRGRKFYWHHDPALLDDCVRNDRLAPFESSDETIQNRTAILLDRDNVFRYRVRFVNLDPDELGMLLWSIRLEPDLAHHLGGGRPIGLGSVRVRDVRLELIDRTTRYRRLRPQPHCPERTAAPVEPYIEKFFEWMRETFAVEDPTVLANFRDLRFMLRYGSGTPSPIQYPPGLPGHELESFKWFQINRRRGGRAQTLPEPGEELGEGVHQLRLQTYDR